MHAYQVLDLLLDLCLHKMCIRYISTIMHAESTYIYLVILLPYDCTRI